jgi:3-hydroxyisobutyrate dehydrogenase-like beta-hydroxyacid dehydrogenase
LDKRIGFIGLGEVGEPMSLNLIKKGDKLILHDEISKKIEPIVKEGAQIGASCVEVAKQSDVCIIMVLSSLNVREAILGKKGLIHGVKPGSVVIDMSTIDPVTTREVSQKLAIRGASILDAQVARGVQVA